MCHLRKQLLNVEQLLRYNPHSHPQPLSRPAGRERGAQQPYLVLGLKVGSSRWTANVQSGFEQPKTRND
jgi:hypothetical protein